MYRIDFPVDAKEAAVISRRRRAEEERKKRIFNPRERIIGKDLKALQEQINDKCEQKQKEKALEEAWLRETQRQQGVIRELQRRTEEDKKKVWMDVQEFRKNCQRFEDRREFDLNDQRKLAYAARLHDEDVRNGPASMQKFEGEDLTYRSRVSAQEQQKRFWLDHQIAEKKQNEREFDEAHKMYEQRLKEMALRVNDLNRGENEARRHVETAYREYNQALAQEKAEQKNLERVADEEATLAHQLNMYHSELLSEVTDATSVNGPFRIAKDRFKGYTEEQIKTFKEEQWRQALDKKRREKEERSFDSAFEKMQRRYNIATIILDKELDSRKKDKQIELTNMNRELAEEQRLRQCYMNNLVYKGNTLDSFFDQFNTTTR